MKQLTRKVKRHIVRSSIMKPFVSIIFYIRGLFCYVYFITGITKKNREAIKAIKETMDYDYVKPIKQYAAHSTLSIMDYLSSYKNKSVKVIKHVTGQIKPNEPVLLCVTRNDLCKVKAQVEYHRSIGVEHFVYIDNESTDGTFEWLYEQSDVSLCSISEQYSPIRQRAWRNQAVNIFGYGYWYLNLDSDEFFTYPGIENIPITDYIQYAEMRNIKSVFAPMIDMYSNKGVFNDMSNCFRQDCCYFDTDTYKIYKTFTGLYVYGGPRSRAFHFVSQLAKYPLVKMTHGRVIGGHSNYPYKTNFDSNRAIAFLLHYKTFESSEIEKYREYARTEIYSNDSAECKQYIKLYRDNPDLTMYTQKSRKYDSSLDLLEICIVDKDYIRKFLAWEEKQSK